MNNVQPPSLHLAVRHCFLGMAYGMKQPFLVVHVTEFGTPDLTCDAILAARCQAALRLHPHRPLPQGHPSSQRVLNWLGTVQHEAGLPIVSEGQIRQSLRQPDGSWWSSLLVPYLPGLPQSASLIVDWLGLWLTTGALDDVTAFQTALEDLISTLRAMVPRGRNDIHLLRAAQENDIPWDWIAGNCHQFGWGIHALRMDSTFTDRSPLLGANLARKKHHAARVLRRAGLPVPAHALVTSADEAVQAASQLGYPVVVKPADKDGGVGVAAGLSSEAAVRRAFDEAWRLSHLVLVEKHVDGKDYRLLVFNRNLVWTTRRQPGGVTGDGQLDIAALVRLVNLDPRRSAVPGAGLKPLLLDDVALELLHEQGMTIASVPQRNEFVRLRRVGNVAMGGVTVPDNDNVHPDNRQLAEQAAIAFGLDFAGIDLLIPDIGTSWRESGAAICDVNGQPQIADSAKDHLYGEVLRTLVPHSGRIPVLVVVGAIDHRLQAHIESGLRKVVQRIGMATSRGAALDGVAQGQHDQIHSATRALLDNRQVEAVLVWLSDASALHTGLPVDRFDRMLVTPDIEVEASSGALCSALVRMFAPQCAGTILVSESAEWLVRDAGSDLAPGNWVVLPTHVHQEPDAVRAALAAEFTSALMDPR